MVAWVVVSAAVAGTSARPKSYGLFPAGSFLEMPAEEAKGLAPPAAVHHYRAAEAAQEGFQEFFLRDWCRQVEFHRARHNSTEMSLDVLRALTEGQPPRPLGRLASWLRDDLDALLFLRFPQIPSSRPFGTYPVDSVRGYRTRVGLGQAGLDIGENPRERPFPDHLQEACER